VGILVHLAMKHVEVLQILDTGNLLRHFSEVLNNSDSRTHLWKDKYCADFDEDFLGVDKFQEFLVFHYLANLMKYLDKLDEEKILNIVDQLVLVTTAVDHVEALKNKCSDDVLVSFFKFLNYLIDCETYLTDKDRFISSNVKSRYRNFCDEYLNETIEKNNLVSKDFQMLFAEISRWQQDLI